MSKFKIGDRVHYVGQNRALRGLTGAVSEVRSADYYRVILDNGRRVITKETNLLPAKVSGTRPSLVIYDEVGHCPRPQTVNVYDRANGERLLGFLAKRPMASVQGRCLKMAVSRPIGSWFDEDALSRLEVDTIHFDFDYRRSVDGYSMDLVFRTDAPLKLLMQLPTFRLPGETDAQAERRRYA